MSLHPQGIGEVPEETAEIAQAAFPKGNLYMRMRDELGNVYRDEDFADLFPAVGQPAASPWRLALITVMQFAENLTDRQAADAVRSRIDWKYALGLELRDAGFHFSVLSDFRMRLIEGEALERLLTRMLEVFTRRVVCDQSERATQSKRTATHRLDPCPSEIANVESFRIGGRDVATYAQ